MNVRKVMPIIANVAENLKTKKVLSCLHDNPFHNIPTAGTSVGSSKTWREMGFQKTDMGNITSYVRVPGLKLGVINGATTGDTLKLVV